LVVVGGPKARQQDKMIDGNVFEWVSNIDVDDFAACV
jgi:hypothetical protein